jgi:outer membrane protein insertion porin family
VQFTGFPIKKPVAESDVVDVTINLNEDKQYFVNRIEFKGNTTTRDKVIRREMWLNEQDVMNMELLKMSIRRINQLGYFQPIEEPEIQPVANTDNKLDITLRLEEQNRNQFTFGGGVSGLEGAFINLAFSTTNFLGRGETASFSSNRKPDPQLPDRPHRPLLHGPPDHRWVRSVQTHAEAPAIHPRGYGEASSGEFR